MTALCKHIVYVSIRAEKQPEKMAHSCAREETHDRAYGPTAGVALFKVALSKHGEVANGLGNTKMKGGRKGG